jgi:Helicase conserved C-terminal domain
MFRTEPAFLCWMLIVRPPNNPYSCDDRYDALAMGLAESLAELSDAELAQFFAFRPELADPVPATFADLAVRSTAAFSVHNCVAALNQPQREVLDAIAYLSEPCTINDICAVPSLHADPVVVAEIVAQLRAFGLVVPNDVLEGSVFWTVPVALKRAIPSPFALRAPMAKLLDRYTAPDIRMIAMNLGVSSESTTKSGVMAEIINFITTPGALDSLWDRALPGCDSVLRGVHDELGGIFALDTRPWSRKEIPEPIAWLLSHGLLLPLDQETVVIAQELSIMLRGGSPIMAFSTEPPAVATRSAKQLVSTRSGVVALTPGELISAVAAIGHEWGRSVPAPLKTGGVGVKEIRAMTKIVGVDEASTARLVELAGAAGLLVADDYAGRLGPTPRFDEWLKESALDRWMVLVRTWADLPRSLSAVVGIDEVRGEPPLQERWYSSPDEIWRRARVMEAVASVGTDGPATNPAAAPAKSPKSPGSSKPVILPSLPGIPAIPGRAGNRVVPVDPSKASASSAKSVGVAAPEPVETMSVMRRARWFGPGRWGDGFDGFDATELLMVEAALVGVMNGGAITPLGRAALFGSADDVAEIAASIFAAPVSTFTVSGDLTVLAPAELDATTSGELSLIADITSKGTASVYKITELSLRRAFDSGRTPEQIMAFLEEHARPGVPQPLRYLVDDVARRYGSVRIGAATSYVRVEDVALLAELVRSKKLAKCKFRLIAPTVAVSPLVSAKILSALRDAGFLPVEEGPDGVVLAGQAESRETSPFARHRRTIPTGANAIWAAVAGGYASSANSTDATSKPAPNIGRVIDRLRGNKPPTLL